MAKLKNSVHQEVAPDKAVDALIMDMIETIHITYTDSSWPKGQRPTKELNYSEFNLEHARDLQKYVCSEIIECSNYVRYEKIVVIKEDELANLRSRLSELMKNEECRRVNFGVFTSIAKDEVKNTFEACAKSTFKSMSRGKNSNPIGRIWSVEINGSGRGCGVIAGDDKIYIWRDK